MGGRRYGMRGGGGMAWEGRRCRMGGKEVWDGKEEV